MGIVDGVDLDLGARMAEPKLLENFIVLVNVTCSLGQDVGFQTINLVADGNATASFSNSSMVPFLMQSELKLSCGSDLESLRFFAACFTISGVTNITS